MNESNAHSEQATSCESIQAVLRLQMVASSERSKLVYRPSLLPAPSQEAGLPPCVSDMACAARIADRRLGLVDWPNLVVPACPVCGMREAVLRWDALVDVDLVSGQFHDIRLSAKVVPGLRAEVSCNVRRRHLRGADRVFGCESRGADSCSVEVGSVLADVARAFFLGVVEYRDGVTTGWNDDVFLEVYDSGRDWAHQVTARVHDDCVS